MRRGESDIPHLPPHRKRSVDKDRALVARAKAGDAQARDEIILSAVRLAYSVGTSVARRTPNLDVDDVTSTAILRLCQSWSRYLDEAPNGSPGASFGTYAFYQCRGGAAESIRKQILRQKREADHIPIEPTAGIDAPDTELGPAELAERSETILAIQTVVSRLAPRDKRIIMLRFGLDGAPPRTLQAIGDEVGLTKERVRQLETKALKRLRELLGPGFKV